VTKVLCVIPSIVEANNKRQIYASEDVYHDSVLVLDTWFFNRALHHNQR
jgi:hypothetical protein